MYGLSSPDSGVQARFTLQGSHAVHLPTSYLAFNESKPRETAKPSAKELLEGSFNLNAQGNTWAANGMRTRQYDLRVPQQEQKGATRKDPTLENHEKTPFYIRLNPTQPNQSIQSYVLFGPHLQRAIRTTLIPIYNVYDF